MTNQTQTFTGVRVETLKNCEDFERRLKHNYRKRKSQNLVDKRNFYYLDFKNKNWKNIKEINSLVSKSKLKNSKIEYLKRENKRKENKNFHTKRTRILGEGILYFSQGINKDFEENKKLFFDKLNKFILKFNKEFNTKIIDIVVHVDEKGNYHSHFLFENFDKNRNSLNITRSRERGGKLQDIAGEIFKDFGQGYQRGIKKERGKKHLTIREYKEYQKRLEENKDLKNENEKLKNINKDLKNINKEIFKTIKIIYGDLINLSREEDRIKFLHLFKRYFRNENKKRIESLITKYQKKVIKYNKSFEKFYKQRRDGKNEIMKIIKEEKQEEKEEEKQKKQTKEEEEEKKEEKSNFSFWNSFGIPHP